MSNLVRMLKGMFIGSQEHPNVLSILVLLSIDEMGCFAQATCNSINPEFNRIDVG